jgi:hypothetical protein
MAQPGMQPGAQTGQPPFGQSSATGPTANRGYEAAALQKLGPILKQLHEVVPLVGFSSEIGKAVMDAISKIAKLVPAGSVSPASESNQLQNALMRSQQQNAQMQSLKPPGGMLGGPSGGGAPGGMPGGGPGMPRAA